MQKRKTHLGFSNSVILKIQIQEGCNPMRLLSIVGNSLGCSASGERLVSAARDGDFQEAKALLQDNPRLVRYSTNGVKNSPLHYSAAQGHHEIVTLLLGSGVDINLRNCRGQTALMQGCEYGHWEVVQTLILFKADIHRTDYVTSGTALHLAALNGHTRCVRLLLADYIPSIANAWDVLRNKSEMEQVVNNEFNTSALFEVINKPADGGLTPLHMASLHGHLETVQLLLDLGASVTTVTVEDGSSVDPIGPGSTPLHYAACGGNAHCCQILIARGASVTAQNENGWIPLMVARSWNRDSILEILSTPQDIHMAVTPSPYLCLPLMSIINIARECGTRNSELSTTCEDPCTVCLERKCTVASEGCNHELCTRCALYLCTMNHSTAAVSKGPLGSIPCHLCRAGIFSFTKLESSPKTRPENNKGSFSPPLIRSSFRSLSCHRLSTMKLNTGLVCMGSSDTSSPCLISGSNHRSVRNHFNRMSLRRSSSNAEGRKSSRFFSLNHCVPNNNAR